MTAKKDTATGTWYFVVDLPSPDGKRRQIRRRGFATKKEAKAALDGLTEDVRHGLHVDRNRLTLGQYLADQWLPTRGLSPSTIEVDTIAVNKWIVPHLGAVRLQVIDPAMVTQFLGVMLAVGRSPKYVRNVHGVLRKALADARRLGLVRTNAAADVELPSVRRGEMRAWDGEQLGRFLRRVESDRLGPLWRFVIATGVRRGEALGEARRSACVGPTSISTSRQSHSGERVWSLGVESLKAPRRRWPANGRSRLTPRRCPCCGRGSRRSRQRDSSWAPGGATKSASCSRSLTGRRCTRRRSQRCSSGSHWTSASRRSVCTACGTARPR